MKKGYTHAFPLANTEDKKWYRTAMWKLNIFLKVKYFLWIALSNTILTWENFQKRTWKDTGIFFLCKNNSEDVSHMLISCQFNQQV